MAARTQDGGTQAMARALAIPIRSASATPSFRDLTRISRRLVFSLDNRSPGPANRISEARIYVYPLDGTRFVSWNRIENDYQTVDLGKLNLSQERSASAELGLALPVLSATPSVSASAGSTLQEETLLRQRRTALTGALTPRQAMLLQQGGTGIDLTGNVTADFELAVPRGGDQTVFVASLPAVCEQQPSFDRQTLRYPAKSAVPGRDTLGPETVLFGVELRYVLRDVLRGHETLVEGDDSVVFREGVSRVDTVAVIPSEALRFAVFELRMHDTGTVMIQGATPGGTAERVAPLQFATFEEAAAMLTWMRHCKVAAVVFPLTVEGRRLQGDDAQRLHVWRTPVNYGGPGGEMPVRR